MWLKFNKMSKVWKRWGLRFLSDPTYRIGLATIIVAASMTVTPGHAHELLEDSMSEFRMLRAITSGTATFKRFLSQASAFILVYPDRLAEVVDCRVDTSVIREGSTNEHIPIKGFGQEDQRQSTSETVC